MTITSPKLPGNVTTVAPDTSIRRPASPSPVDPAGFKTSAEAPWAVCRTLFSESPSVVDGCQSREPSSPNSAWRSPDFDDSDWDQGKAPIGYGDPHEDRVAFRVAEGDDNDGKGGEDGGKTQRRDMAGF